MKFYSLFLILIASAHAEIWEKPPYRPDENHLPREELNLREAQEERNLKEEKKKENTTKTFREIDDEMKEGEELSQ